MYDMHYDLLTSIYIEYKNNNLNKIKKWIKNYNINNVNGLIANMCFMSIDEMKEEYHKEYYNENIIDMFKLSTHIFKSIIDKDIDYIFGIEGFDYLNISDVDELYNLGLRSVNIVWNEPNKYASGIRGDYGLTEEGRKLIDKLIELNIAIDLSHANNKTFNDIIEIVKQYQNKGIYPVVYASHSNSKELCNRVRNLSNEQLYKLKSIGGYVGVMSNKNFVTMNALEDNISDEILRLDYIKHIMHIGNIIGFDKVFVSTDDMSFCYGDPDYQKLSIYNYSTINKNLKEDLLKFFYEDTVDKILYENSNEVFNKLETKCKVK